jgi:hypothetical protein
MALKVEIHLTKHDREIAAIRKLILTGMKMIVKNDQKREQHSLRMEGAQFELRQQQIAMREEFRQQQIAIREELRLLAAQQRETSKTVDRFIRSMERGRNGHT